MYAPESIIASKPVQLLLEEILSLFNKTKIVVVSVDMGTRPFMVSRSPRILSAIEETRSPYKLRRTKLPYSPSRGGLSRVSWMSSG
jgi:hypothetical protein